ncbi:MAG TPA: BatA and WFA domain-containing protein [Flavobacterium sp.]
MQFKHPEIFYFLFLLVIPILVHLFQLRRFKKEYFTNVQFLKELSVQTRKSSKIKKWLLLCTRLLILASLIFAFAQPFLKAKDSNATTNEMYIVLDNSFSMQAKGQKGELLKRAIEDLLQHAPENQVFSLFTNTAVFWNTDIKSIQKELQNLKYSAAPFGLESVMAKIKSRKSPYNKDIVIITDAIGLQTKQLSSIDKGFNTTFIIPKAEQTNNITIDSVYMKQTLDKFYEISIELAAYGDVTKEAPVALYNNKKLIAKTLLRFNSKKETISFTIPKEDFNGYATIEDTGLEYDNTFYFTITKPKKINVLSIGEADKSIFLSKIYTPAEFSYVNFDILNLDYNTIEKQDAIVLNELKEIPQALQTTLKNFVEKGGNVIVIPSGKNPIPNINALLSGFGNIQFKTFQNAEKLITKIAFNHPLYAAVFEKKIDNFQYPNTKTSFAISSANPMALSYQDQSAFLTSISNATASVYVFSAPINKVNSNFQNSPLIVPTFYNMAQSTQRTGVTALTIGNSQPFIMDTVLSKEEIVTIKNETEKFIPVQQLLSNKVKLTFNDYPQQAGNFGMYKQNELIKNISFNYNRTESDLFKNNESILTDFKTSTSIENIFDTLQKDRTNNEIWKWFVLLALLFIVTEVFIQKFVK